MMKSIDWKRTAPWVLSTIECPTCRGFGAELDGTYPCTQCRGKGRVRSFGKSNDRIPKREKQFAAYLQRIHVKGRPNKMKIDNAANVFGWKL